MNWINRFNKNQLANNPQTWRIARRSMLSMDLKGFTIIEVMIVLAIAGLILLVVFLAVPALQRSQRNNARKSDASRVAASVVDFTSNKSDGSVPSTAADCKAVKDAAANLSQYASLASACTVIAAGSSLPNAATLTALTADTMYLAKAPTASTAGTPSRQVMILATQAQCDTATAGAVVASGTRQSALLYTVESGSAWSWACVNPQ